MASQADEKLHFDLSMSRDASETLQTIADTRQLSVSDVLSRAIALFVESEKARQAGGSLGVLDAEKKPVAELIGF